MLFLIFAAIVALVFGILFLVSPQTISKMQKQTNKTIVSAEEQIYSLRIGIGISFLLSSFLFLFVAYYLLIKYG